MAELNSLLLLHGEQFASIWVVGESTRPASVTRLLLTQPHRQRQTQTQLASFALADYHRNSEAQTR